jgi:hypothetical protein
MSNIGNIFGNEGWIQSSIDRSRGKTRPGGKRRKARRKRARRQRELEADIAAGRIGGLVAGQKAVASTSSATNSGGTSAISILASRIRARRAVKSKGILGGIS